MLKSGTQTQSAADLLPHDALLVGGPKKEKQHCTFSFFCFPTVAGKLFQICKSEKLMFIETEKFFRGHCLQTLSVFAIWSELSTLQSKHSAL